MATYMAGEDIGAVFIKATSGDASKDFELQLHPTGTTLNVQVFPHELPANGFADALVSIMVTDSRGAPVAGKLVRLTAGEPFQDMDEDGYFTAGVDTYEDLNGNSQWDAIGQIQTSQTTGLGGQSDVVYTAGHKEGTVWISASTRDSQGGVFIDLLSLPPVAEAELQAPTFEIYANGMDTATFALVLKDVHGQEIPGKTVNLVAGELFEDKDGDGKFTWGVDEILEEVIANGDWDALGSVPEQVSGNMVGWASFDFTTPEVPGTVWFKASADAWSQDFAVEVMPLPGVTDMHLIADHDELNLRDSGGQDRTAVEATLLRAEGPVVPAGVPVTMTVLSGPGALLDESGEEVSQLELETDSVGQVHAIVVAGDTPGTIRLEVDGNGFAKELQIAVSVGPPANMALRVFSPELESWESTTVEAFVTDAYNNPVRDGVRVIFTVDEGMIAADDGSNSAQTFNGQALAFYYSLSPQPGGDGLAEITATTEDGTASAGAYIQIPQADLLIQSLELEAGATEIGVRGAGDQEQTSIIATAYRGDGEPVGQGHPVEFEIMAGPGGGESLEGSEGGSVDALTDHSGRAAVQLKSGDISGTVMIRASAEWGTVTKEITVGIAAGPPAGIECPPVLQAGCGTGEGVLISVFVHDIHHNPVREGTVLHFSASEGLVVGEDGLGTSVTEGGEAMAEFLPPWCSDTGASQISVETFGGEVSCSFAVNLTCGPCSSGEVERLELDMNPEEIRVQETGGSEQAMLTAVGFDIANNRVGAGRPVTFEIIEGPGGGENLDGQGYGPVTIETNANGEASVILGSGTISGTVLLRASSESGVSENALIAIAAGPPVYLSIGVNPCNIRGWDRVGEEAEIVAIVSDVYNNPVRDETRVYFTADEGIVRGAISGELGSAETKDGVALATYLSGDPRENGIVTVTASTAGGTVVGDVTFIVSGPPVFLQFLYPTPPVGIMANGESQIEVMVEVLDVNMNYVLDGTEVEFLSDFGTVEQSATTADGCYGSIATSKFTSEVLSGDFSYTIPDDGIGATAYVTARAGLGGGAAASLPIQLYTGSANANNSKLEVGESDLGPGGVTALNISIKDRYGNPLGGHLLDVTAIGGGTVNPGSMTTDMWGEANGLYTAPADSAVVTIQVIDQDPGYGGVILTESVNVSGN
jgi:hypothetical protein